ncbi:unnamed protein product [Caretta caretta]
MDTGARQVLFGFVYLDPMLQGLLRKPVEICSRKRIRLQEQLTGLGHLIASRAVDFHRNTCIHKEIRTGPWIVYVGI